MFVMFLLQDGIYLEVEKREILALTQVLQPATILKNILDRHVQATFKYYKSVSA